MTTTLKRPTTSDFLDGVEIGPRRLSPSTWHARRCACPDPGIDDSGADGRRNAAKRRERTASFSGCGNPKKVRHSHQAHRECVNVASNGGLSRAHATAVPASQVGE